MQIFITKAGKHKSHGRCFISSVKSLLCFATQSVVHGLEAAASFGSIFVTESQV